MSWMTEVWEQLRQFGCVDRVAAAGGSVFVDHLHKSVRIQIGDDIVVWVPLRTGVALLDSQRATSRCARLAAFVAEAAAEFNAQLDCEARLAEVDDPQFKRRSIDITGGVPSEDFVRRLRDEEAE